MFAAEQTHALSKANHGAAESLQAQLCAQGKGDTIDRGIPRDRALFAGGRCLMRLALNAKIHDVIAANGAVVNHDVPGPQRNLRSRKCGQCHEHAPRRLDPAARDIRLQPSQCDRAVARQTEAAAATSRRANPARSLLYNKCGA